MHILGMIRKVNRGYFSKCYSGFVIGMHIIYCKVKTENLNICYVTLYCKNSNNKFLFMVRK